MSSSGATFGEGGLPLDPGLCADCRHRRWVRSARGGAFLLCRRSASDPAFPRYPRLPVRACAGHEPAGAGGEGPSSPSAREGSRWRDRVRRHGFLSGLFFVAAAAIAFPEGGQALRSARAVLPALSATALFLSGLALETAHLRLSAANARAIALCLGTTYGVAPALARILVELFGPAAEPERAFFREAVAIAAAQAGTIASAPALVLVAGGNHALALLATLASNGLTAVATPLVLFVVLGARIAFPLGEMAEQLLRLVVAPIVGGQILRRILRAHVRRALPAVRILSQGIILVFVYTGISAASAGGAAPAGLTFRFFALAGTLHGGLLAWGWAMAWAFGLSPRDRTAVVLCGAQKTLPNGIYVWDRFFPANPHGALAIVAYHVFQLVADTLLLPWLAPSPGAGRPGGGWSRPASPGASSRGGVFRGCRPAG